MKPLTMNVFDGEDYYPVPSTKVITFGDTVGSKRKKSILKTDLVALIVHLSSPMGEVDYTAFSDLFLVYRNFMSPMELSDLLIMRFRWCMQEASSTAQEKDKIGKIALVRTFVLLRHWILNYFVQDFLPDVNLRIRVIKFLNENPDQYPKIVKTTLVSLKKTWVYSTKVTWTNLALDEPDIIGKNNEWEKYQVQDYTQLRDNRKRDSQLSFHARQGASSPNFRNQSVLSLFKNTDIFKLPDVGRKKMDKPFNQRTGSMVLYPCDNSNRKDESEKTPDRKTVMDDKEVDQKHKERVAKISSASVPLIIKNVKCLESPGIDKLIPPTPAKRVEFILKLPENLDSEAASVKRNEEVARHSVAQQTRHRGAMGLLSKWRKNHSNFSLNSEVPKPDRGLNGYSKPAMDTFVKYVISITSLENREHENEELSHLIHSKFDILSARTIEEVEYLVSIENELVKKVYDTIPSNKLTSDDPDVERQVEDNLESPQIAFSAVDNLNLYQTVSSIANSVLSLSKTLDDHRKQQPQNNTLSPSFAALERRKVQSSMAAVMHNRSRFSLVSQYNYAEEKYPQNTDSNDGPERLIFRDSNGCNKFGGISASDPTLNFSPSKRIPNSNRTSPLKQVLPNLYEIKARGDDQRDSYVSSISYDSQLSNTSKNDKDLKTSDPVDSEYGIKKKVAQDNLREFTFEQEKEDVDVDVVENADVESTSSFVTTREYERQNEVKSSKTKAVASGRISLIRKQTPRLSTPELNLHLPMERAERDTDFFEKDKALLRSELEILQLEKNSAIRSSMAMSVNTDILFESEPRKSEDQLEHSRIELNKTPTIKTIKDGVIGQAEVGGTNIVEYEKAQNVNVDVIKSSLIQHLNKETSTDSSLNFLNANENNEDISASATSNKYLFSPDNDSADISSPARNVEELKDRFLKNQISDQNEDMDKTVTSQNENNDENKHASVRKENENLKNLDGNNIVDIANLPDDSVHEDPVNVALMKLEGTYKKYSDSEANASSGSPTASDLADEVNILGIAELAVPPKSPADKRRSLLIERRRQTMVDYPFTPRNNTPDPHVDLGVEPAKIAELLNGYEAHDPRLLVSNRAEHVPFILMYDSLSIAQQMTLIERELLGEIDWNELLNLNLAYSAPHITSWLQLLVRSETLSGIDLAIARFNLTVDWIISEIVMTSDVKLKRNTIQRFIHVAEHCKSFQNFNTLMQIILALSSTVVQKFSDAWRLIEPGDLLTWEELKQIPSLDRNYASIRQLLNSMDPIKGCVPFIVVYLSDLSLNSEKRSWFVAKEVVNYNKFDTNVQIVKNFIQKVQWSKFYDFTTDNELLSKCVYLTALTPEEINYLTTNAVTEDIPGATSLSPNT